MQKNYRIDFLIVPIISIFLIKISSAQIVGDNCFLQGSFVEVGINQCGAYGTDALPPDGYHPSPGLSGLGFVADPDEDGWDEGDPEYCGDYFVPGSPVEGWAVQIGDDIYVNTDQYCIPDAIPGEITEYSYAGGVYTGIWEGDISSYDLHIEQITTLPEDKVYFVTRVLLCNDGDELIEDVYYTRNVDPDNDQPWSGDFTTENIIVSNPPDDVDALVTSEGLTYGCFLGMGARDTNARASYGNFSTAASPPESSWSGTGGYVTEVGSSETSDIATQINFYIPEIEPGTCKCVAFAYILDVEDLEEALEATIATTLLVNSEPIPSSDTVYVCLGDSINLEVLGADDYSWTWAFSGGTFNTDTGTLVVGSSIEDIDVTATGTGGFCGDAVANVHIVIDDDLIPVDAGEDESLCIGQSTTLNGSGGVTYLWTPSTGLTADTIANPISTPESTTTYTLTVTNIHGCDTSDEITITVNPLPVVSAGDDLSICQEGQGQLSATGAVEYSWSPGTGLSCSDCPDPITTVDDDITYIVTGTDENGCINVDEVFVAVDLTPPVDAGPDATINIVLGETAILDPTGGVTYVWSPAEGLSCTDCENPVAQPQDTTTYYVLVTDANGCQNIDSVTIYVIGIYSVDLPTAFSPNGDGFNDTYFPLITGYGDLDHYTIYNRWGEVVFESDDTSIGWDGTYKNKEQVVGTYVVVVYSTVQSQVQIQQENFVLVR
jgi:gliding motility-associated-like protein